MEFNKKTNLESLRSMNPAGDVDKMRQEMENLRSSVLKTNEPDTRVAQLTAENTQLRNRVASLEQAGLEFLQKARDGRTWDFEAFEKILKGDGRVPR